MSLGCDVIEKWLSARVWILGVVAMGHSLFSTVRRRNRDFAVLRALGITRGGSRVIVASLSSTVAIVGLALGIPIGLVAGRLGWHAIADRVPLTFRSPVTIAGILIVAPVAVVIANALAVLPARRAARVDPAAVLRAE